MGNGTRAAKAKAEKEARLAALEQEFKNAPKGELVRADYWDVKELNARNAAKKKKPKK